MSRSIFLSSIGIIIGAVLLGVMFFAEKGIATSIISLIFVTVLLAIYIYKLYLEVKEGKNAFFMIIIILLWGVNLIWISIELGEYLTK